MPGRYGAVAQRPCLPPRHLEHRLRLLGEAQVTLDSRATADERVDARPPTFRRGHQQGDGATRYAVLVADQPEQQVFGADVRVAEASSFFAPTHHDSTSSI